MRRARVKGEGDSFYHVMSRCALQEFLLTDEVKGMFLRMLRRAERFSGVRVLNYCVMGNHFHLLLEVPQRCEIPDAELDVRVRALYGESRARRIFARWDAMRRLGGGAGVERERNALRRRMYDLSEFMKTFKQRFTLWYCANHGKLEGTIWQGAFHSVLVEGGREALDAISAYISLNPVRANLVADPGDYAWSGYGAAKAGDAAAKAALLSTSPGGRSAAERWRGYVAMLQAALDNPVAQAAAGGAGAEKPDTQPGETGEPPRTEGAMRSRDRDVSRGVAFGSEDFVAAAIRKASRLERILTFPRVFCSGERLTPLFCAGRRRGQNMA